MICGCARENILSGIAGSGDMVSVSLNLGMAPLESGTRADITYDVDDPVSPATTTIKNVWVLQFDGTTDDALLVSSSYVENYSTGSDIQLKATDHDNRIVFLANTFNPSTAFPVNAYTLAQLKTYSSNEVLNRYSVLGREHVSDTKYTLYPMFNGETTVNSIGTGTQLTCTLKRNIARLKITVRNTTSGDDRIELKTIKIMKVPTISYNYTCYSEFPTASADADFPLSSTLSTVDYEEVPWDAAGDATQQTFTFYVPFNLRGGIDNGEPMNKNALASDKATRCMLLGEYTKSGHKYPIAYTFVLGANMTDDCNLEPNKSYNYTFEISKKGNQNIDSRVEDLGPMDYTLSSQPRANCYILNPPAGEGLTRDFLIPVDRILEFWGGDMSNNHNGMVYEQDYTKAMVNCSVANQKWTAEILWTDFQNTEGQLTLSKDKGTAAYPPSYYSTASGDASYDSYFTATVKSGVTGNALICVRRDNDPNHEILWSWHLWITDYSPDDVRLRTPPTTPKPGQYFYPVKGGEVHSYATAAFQPGGINAGRFIMDRNVGEYSVAWDGSVKGQLYYQFGRKDPIPSATLYGTQRTIVDYSTLENNNKNVLYSIANPTKLIYNKSAIDVGTWTLGDKYNPSDYNNDIMWHDPYATPENGRKSVFDPCPSGWMLPRNGTWAGISTSNSIWSTVPAGTGRYYYPDKTNFPNSYVYYPASGGFYFISGAIAYANSMYEWSSSPSVKLGKPFNSHANGIAENTAERACGFPVRCVQEFFN